MVEAVTKPEDSYKGNGAEHLTGKKSVLQDLLEGDSERPAMKGQEALPELTDAHINQDIAVITDDCWNLQCWSCQHGAHSSVTCPYLSTVQRLY